MPLFLGLEALTSSVVERPWSFASSSAGRRSENRQRMKDKRSKMKDTEVVTLRKLFIGWNGVSSLEFVVIFG